MVPGSPRCKFWFGTEGRADWFPTPLQGADSSPSAWTAGGTLLSGGGWGIHSWSSHKQYTYEWPSSSSPVVAQRMKSYFDGTYGRGLLYFLDPLIYGTNVLPAHWADPSMGVGGESPSLVPGVEPTGVVTSGAAAMELPAVSAFYSQGLPDPSGLDDSNSVFVPIPRDYTLFFGAYYSASDSGDGVYVVPINANGTAGTPTRITPQGNASTDLVTETFSGALRGVRVAVIGASGSVTIAAMIGRLLKTSDVVVYGPWEEQVRNLFTNPRFVGGAPVEVRRNYCRTTDLAASVAGWTVAGGVTQTVEADGRRFATGISNGNAVFYRTSNAETVAAPGEAWSAGFVVRNNAPSAAGFRTYIAWIVDGVAQTVDGPIVTIDPGATAPVLFENVVAPAGTTNVRFGLRWATGAAFDATVLNGPLLEKSPVLLGPPFDGSGSPDPDMTASWTGPVNNSPSVLTGIGVANVSAANAARVPIMSTFAGLPAMRVIRLGGSGSLDVNTNSISSPTGSTTAILTMGRRDAALTSLSHSIQLQGNIGTQGWVTLLSSGGPASLPLGEPVPLRGTLTSAHTNVRLRMASPTTVGASVYYMLASVVAGEYAGDYFDGSMGDISDTQRYRWVGTPDASATVYETRWRTGSPGELSKITSGPWVGGAGHSGCRFASPPTYVSNSPISGGRVGFAATFREVGSWVYG